MDSISTWWQKKIHPSVALGVIMLLIVCIAFALAVNRFGWDWTGFTGGERKTTITNTSKGTTTSTELQSARTLWDWLQLLGVLAIPVVVGLGAAWYTAQQGKVRDRENTDNQREIALQTYIDRMSELLQYEHLGNSPLSPEQPTPQVLVIAQARTATVLRILDPIRRGSLIQFLYRAKLIEANLSKVNLKNAFLVDAFLGRANLESANLEGADLSGAYLKKAKVTTEQLAKAKSLKGATIYRKMLPGSTIRRTSLKYRTAAPAL